MITHKQRVKLFGEFEFKHAPRGGNPEGVAISIKWANENLVIVDVPAMKRLWPASYRPITCHRLAARPLQLLWATWEAEGLLAFELPLEPAYARTINTHLELTKDGGVQEVAKMRYPLRLVNRFNGMWVARFKRQKGTWVERANKCAKLGAAALSNHAWGTAFDIDAHIWPLGKVVPADHPYRKLVPIAKDLGWGWGGDYKSRPDGMHWELERV